MAQWLVKLSGDEHDLRILSTLYTEPDCHVSKSEGGAYLLSCDKFSSGMEAAEIHAASRDKLAIINDLMRFRDTGYQAVSVDQVIRINDDGTQSHIVLLSSAVVLGGGSRLTAELTVIGPDGKVAPSPEPAISRARLKLAEENANVREALIYWGRCDLGDGDICVNAYKVYEIIREDLASGGDKGLGTEEIKRRRWATQDEIKDFKAWANNRSISGGRARHAENQQVESGITPLSEGDAVALIKRLLGNWLDWKTDQMTSGQP